jgi:hypothetical protein
VCPVAAPASPRRAPFGDRRQRRSALALPFPAWGAAPGEAVVVTRLLSGDDDVMPQTVANHATRVKDPEYGGGTGAIRLRIAPRLEAPHPARLGRIQPRYALKQELAVLARETGTERSPEWHDLSLHRRGQKHTKCERS